MYFKRSSLKQDADTDPKSVCRSLQINNAQNLSPQHVINNERVYSLGIFTAAHKLGSPVMGALCYYPFYHINNHKYGRKNLTRD